MLQGLPFTAKERAPDMYVHMWYRNWADELSAYVQLQITGKGDDCEALPCLLFNV